MKEILITLSITLLFSACASFADVNSISKINHNANLEEIDIDQAVNMDKMVFSSYFKEPKTIVLEKKEDCIIKEITSLEIFNNRIYILDSELNKLYVFKKDGTFEKTIGEKGRGHGEYLEISDFSIDRSLKILYLWDEALDMAHKYKLPTGEYISSVKTERNGARTYCMLFFNKRLYLNRSSEDASIKYHIKEIDESNGNQTASYLSSDEYNLGWNYPLRISNSYFYCKNSKEPKYIEMFSDTIIGFTEKGLQPAYAIKSKDFVKKQDIEHIVSKQGENNLYDMSKLYNSNKIYQISCLAENESMLIFKYIRGDSPCFLLYDRIKNKSITSEIMSNDYIARDNTIPMDIMYCDKKYALSVLNPIYMKYFVDYFVSKNKISPELDNYDSIKQLKEDSNPVLFLHEYK